VVEVPYLPAGVDEKNPFGKMIVENFGVGQVQELQGGNEFVPVGITL
jgi:hypothetical protein